MECSTLRLAHSTLHSTPLHSTFLNSRPLSDCKMQAGGPRTEKQRLRFSDTATAVFCFKGWRKQNFVKWSWVTWMYLNWPSACVCMSIKSVCQRCQALGEMIGFTTRFLLVLDFFRQQESLEQQSSHLNISCWSGHAWCLSSHAQFTRVQRSGHQIAPQKVHIWDWSHAWPIFAQSVHLILSSKLSGKHSKKKW